MNIEGQGLSNLLFPPDTVGAVGPNHYVQMVNAEEGSHFTVLDKKTGNVLLGPVATSSLAPPSTPCSIGSGDPIVAYDELADRWVVSEFLPPTGFQNGLCVNVSQTSDPADNLWYHYYIPTAQIPDFPKLSVWPSGYVVTSNDIPPIGVPPVAGDRAPAIRVLDRESMLQGLPLRETIRLTVPSLTGFGVQSITAADMDGAPPPPGSPTYLMRHLDDELHLGNAESVVIDGRTYPYDPFHDFLQVWKLDVDFDSSSFSLQELDRIPVAEFDSGFCPATAGRACLPQPVLPDGTVPPRLDPIAEVIMYRLQYRNFGTYETLVGNFTTDTNRRDHAGVHWFELRKAGTGDWKLYQEGTVSPDADHRFMGSIAMDGQGNIALGYSVTSPYVSPSLRYVGRLKSDPLGTMPRGEYTIVNGVGSQQSFRWGDYAAMTVDPSDNSTFYFTGQYANGVVWGTRIAAMTFADIDSPVQPGPVGTVSGLKWDDKDGDGQRDTGEKGVAGTTIYVDLDNNGQLCLCEPAAITDQDGRYRIQNVPVGTHHVREILAPGWEQTYPATVDGSHVVIVTKNGGPIGVDFGNRQATGFDKGLDYGDAPSTFPTLLAQNGASHGIVPGFQLGAQIDGEANGQPTPLANGDDVAGSDDEDGVLFVTELIPGGTGTVRVVVSNGSQPAGLLQAWIDFNRDGTWNTAGEQIFRDQVVKEGINTLTFTVPVWAAEGQTASRFRYGYERGISFTGKAIAGEVEDHLLDIVRGGPIAVDDAFTVRRNSDDNPLNVMANDMVRAGTGTQIVAVTSPSQGGTVSIAQNGLSLLYTSPQNYDGTETFSYTLSDSNGVTDSATVQITIPTDLVALRLRASRLDGTPITQIDVGQDYLLRGYVQDLRKTGATGVFAAYLDVNYPSIATTVSGLITYGPDYDNGQSGSTATSGLIDEVGAFDGLERLGPNELLLFSLRMRADQAGPVTFTPSPADLLPQHNVLLYDLDQPVPLDRIEYAAYTLFVGAQTANLQTNPRNALDVNDDFSVSPIDALLVINELNLDGSARAARIGAASSTYLDVSADGQLSPLDALLIINALNRSSTRTQQTPRAAIAAAWMRDAEAEPVAAMDDHAAAATAEAAVAAMVLTTSYEPMQSLFEPTDRSDAALADTLQSATLEDVLDLIGDDLAGKLS